MKKPLRVGLAILLVAIIGGFALVVLHKREPVNEGRTLTSWLEQAATNLPSLSMPREVSISRDSSKMAVQQIGTNALPALLKMASSCDSPLKSNLMVLVQRLIPLHLYTDEEYHTMAIFGFYALGPIAKDAVPPLCDLLKSQNARIRGTASDILGNIGPPAKAAVPLLIQFIHDTNRIVRWDATVNLGRIHSEPKLVVPLLINNLNKSNADLSTTILALGEFGKDAKAAVPALLRYLNDQNEYVRSEASNSLKEIDPEAAAKAGVR